MDREQARELFSAYRDGDLAADEVVALEALLREDEETREDYERFCRILDSLAGLGQAPAPRDFTEKVKSRIRRRSGGRLFGGGRLSGVPRVPYELFSLVLILIILTVYMLTVPVVQVRSPGVGPGGGERGPEPSGGGVER